MECETVRPDQNPIMTSREYGLNAVHLLRPATGNAMGPLMVNNAIPLQQAANLPVFSTNNGVTDGNKTFHMMGSFITGKRYKRETNLKLSEGSVELCESFRSQFNIHHKMLGWNTNRAGIELYMSLEGKAALKVEEEVTEMWDALDSDFLSIDHHKSKYRQFAMRRWRTGERMTE